MNEEETRDAEHELALAKIEIAGLKGQVSDLLAILEQTRAAHCLAVDEWAEIYKARLEHHQRELEWARRDERALAGT